MPRRNYITVPSTLLEIADAVGDFLESRGYRIGIEPTDVTYPYTPTFRAKQRPTTLFVDVDQRLNMKHIKRWWGYARSCNDDTRIVVAIPTAAPRPARMVDELRSLNVGLFLVDAGNVSEHFEPRDLGLDFELPDIQAPQRLRELMGPVHEKFERGDWREGFGDACGALESQAKRHLKRGVLTGRIVVLTEKGNPQTLTPQRIDRLTLGQLRDTFQRIQNQNLVDTTVHGAIDRILSDRNALVHAKQKKQTEAALRRNVGQNMWAIDSAVRALLDIR